MGFVGIRDGAIKKAKIVDGRLGWPTGTALGKIVLVWENALELKHTKVTPGELLEWAGTMPPGTTPEAYIAALAHKAVRFVKVHDDGELEINGAAEELEKIEERRRRASAGGKASGKARAPEDQPGDDSESTASQHKPGRAEPGRDPSQDPSNKDTPKSPPRRGAPTKRELRDLALIAADDVIAALAENRDAEAARASLSPYAWQLALRHRPRWQTLVGEAGVAYRADDWGNFSARLQKSFVAKARAAARYAAPPTAP